MFNASLLSSFAIIVVSFISQWQSENRFSGPLWLAVFAPWLFQLTHDEYPISTVNLLSHAWVAFKYPVDMEK